MPQYTAKPKALKNKRIEVLPQLVFRVQKVLRTFEKQAPGLGGPSVWVMSKYTVTTGSLNKLTVERLEYQ